MDNSSESPEKASNLAPQWQPDCRGSRISRSILKKIAANPEISVGELVKPKSTLKHLFGTERQSSLSERRGTVQVYRLDWSRMQKELQE
jgi:hypothetical protein